MSQDNRSIHLQTPPQTARRNAAFPMLAVAGLMACLSACSTSSPAPDTSALAPEPGVEKKRKPCVKTIYPEQARRERRAGTTTLEFTIKTDGSVKDIVVAGSSGSPDLDEASRVALAGCVLHPAMVNGEPVERRTKAAYVWALD